MRLISPSSNRSKQTNVFSRFQWFLLGVVGVTLIPFTNCGKGFQTDETVLQSISGPGMLGGQNPEASSPPPPPAPPPSSSTFGFKKGDPISAESFGLIHSRLQEIFTTYKNADSTKPKMIAVTWDYSGYLGQINSALSADATRERAIALCHVNYQKPCFILAIGEQFDISYADAERIKNNRGQGALITSARKGQTFTAQNFVFYGGNSFIEQYLASDRPFKAMAISTNGQIYWQGSSNSQESLIKRSVVEYCQYETKKKCLLIAYSNQYEWEWDKDLPRWSLPQAGDSLALPFSWLPTIAGDIGGFGQSYQNWLEGGSDRHAVIAMLPGVQAWGRLASSGETPQQAAEQLLATCRSEAQKLNIAQDRCVVFAQNRQVVWTIKEQ